MSAYDLKKYIFLFVVGLALQGCAAFERLAVPSPDLIDPALRGESSKSNIDHSAFDDFLLRYTSEDKDGVVRVAYGDVTPTDHTGLKTYIQTLSSMKPTDYTRPAQLAYWVNLYNATAIDIILDHYPVESMRQIEGKHGMRVKGRNLSLHNIKHGIIRPLWPNEPRIHYLLNDTTSGGPNLARAAYTATNIVQKLDEAAAAYIHNPRGVNVYDDGRITVSKLYSWYMDDFGGSETAILAHLYQYAKPELKAVIEKVDHIPAFTYDVSLNDAARPNTLQKPELHLDPRKYNNSGFHD